MLMKTALLASTVLMCSTSIICAQSRRPNKYLIPLNYVGWVLVKYEVKGAPRTPVQNGFNITKFSRAGRFVTSSSPQHGWAKDEFSYISGTGVTKHLRQTGWGRGGMVWGDFISSGIETIILARGSHSQKTIKKSSPTLTMFIGTEQQFKKAGQPPRSQ